MHRRKLAATLLSGLLLTTAAAAQTNYPTKPIRMVVPFAVGGATDVVGRIIGAKMSEILGQQVLIDNRAGAGGNIGSDVVAKAAPDGYTVLAATGSTHTFNPVLYAKIPYDPIKDFAPIAEVVVTPFLLVVNSKAVAATDFKGLIAEIKANPGKFNYGSAGVGTNIHLCSELLKQMAGIPDVAHVPYRGSGPLMNDLIAGQIAMALDPPPTSSPHIQAGAIRPIGAATRNRSRAFPNVPTLAEQGLTGFDCYTWTAFYAPAKTPDAIVRRLAEAVNQALNDKGVAARLAEMGFEPVLSSSPEQLAAFTKAELDRWTPVIRASGVKLD